MIVLIIVLIVVGCSNLLFPYIKLLILGYHETVGRVIDYNCQEEHYHNSSTDMWELTKVYYPIISFQVDGKEYRCISKGVYRKGALDLGEEVKIIYNPKDPTKSASKHNFFGFYLILFAVILFICTKL